MSDLKERLALYTTWRDSSGEMNNAPNEALARIESLEAQLAEANKRLALIEAYPHGTCVRKVSGPQWDAVVVGHYSSSFTPEGLVLENIADGARGQVHVEPAKRVEMVAGDCPRCGQATDSEIHQWCEGKSGE